MQVTNCLRNVWSILKDFLSPSKTGLKQQLHYFDVTMYKSCDLCFHVNYLLLCPIFPRPYFSSQRVDCMHYVCRCHAGYFCCHGNICSIVFIQIGLLYIWQTKFLCDLMFKTFLMCCFSLLYPIFLNCLPQLLSSIYQRISCTPQTSYNNLLL